jgi:hypothetical protein
MPTLEHHSSHLRIAKLMDKRSSFGISCCVGKLFEGDAVCLFWQGGITQRNFGISLGIHARTAAIVGQYPQNERNQGDLLPPCKRRGPYSSRSGS